MTRHACQNHIIPSMNAWKRHFLAFRSTLKLDFYANNISNSFTAFLLIHCTRRARTHTHIYATTAFDSFDFSFVLSMCVRAPIYASTFVLIPTALWFRVTSNLITFQQPPLRCCYFCIFFFYSKRKAYWLEIDWRRPSRV